MHLILSIILYLFLHTFHVLAQSHGNFIITEKEIKDNFTRIRYSFVGSLQKNFVRRYENDSLHSINIGTLGYLQEIGKPALPVWSIILTANPKNFEVKLNPVKIDTIDNILVTPWIGMPIDLKDFDSPEFYIDSTFYSKNVWYPQQVVTIKSRQIYRDYPLLFLQICPFQYNPSIRKLIFFRDFEIIIGFNAEKNKFIRESATNALIRSVLNSDIIKTKTSPVLRKVLIITIDEFLPAAKTLARWQTQKGYSVSIKTNHWWTWKQVDELIRKEYFSSRRPSYLIFLGDHNHVPGMPYVTDFNIFPVDKRYAFLNGKDDYIPDISIGRISVANLNEAMSTIYKIIQYEKNPITLNDFYQTAVGAAYFQDDDQNGYEDRRFVRTAEDILIHLTNNYNKTVHRVYFTESNINPLFWNNDYFGAGEPLPAYLLRPNFLWNGSAFHIRNYINQGTYFVYHRDHAYDAGWAKPSFTISNVNTLTNGSRTPIVSSINCQTGKFVVPLCFAEAFLRHNNGGTIGVFAHAEVSYSGYNDALSLGLVDAFHPGLEPQFTGSAHVSDTIPTHEPIYTAGDIADYGTFYMSKAWGNSWNLEEHQYSIFHYFGDPTTNIFTNTPIQINATFPLFYSCHDTIITITWCNINNALVTLTYENQLIASTQLTNGTGSLPLHNIAYPQLQLTITAPNCIPLIATIKLKDFCLRANFIYEPSNDICNDQQVRFTNKTSGFYQSVQWKFGSSAIPPTSNEDVVNVKFLTPGWHTITLRVSNPFQVDSIVQYIFIDSLCKYTMTLNDEQNIQKCQGILFDNANEYPYASGYKSKTIIHSPGALGFNLVFEQFDIEPSYLCQKAYIAIYQGSIEDSILIGKFCNAFLPPDTLLIQDDTVTVVFYAEDNFSYEGFKLIWKCIEPGMQPVARAIVNVLDLCGRKYHFRDNSLNQPTKWFWNFGDGYTSTEQHPIKEFYTAGSYNVTLIAGNNYGFDTLELSTPIVINDHITLPDTIIKICTPQTIQIHSDNNEKVLWYTSKNSVIPFAYSESIQAYVQSDTSVYCRTFKVFDSLYTAKTDTSGPGSYLNSTTEHYLSFDVYMPIILKEITVYALDEGNRTIRIRNAQDQIIFQQTYYLNAGKNKLILNCLLLPGYEYKISAGTQNKLWRNGYPQGNSFYPIQAEGIINITRSSADYPYSLKYYYFFYDWKILLLCEGPPSKKEIKLLIPQANLQYYPSNNLCLSDTIVIYGPPHYQYFWYPQGDTLNNYIIVTQPGTFSAQISIENCNIQSNAIQITGNQPPNASFSYVIDSLTVSFFNQSIGTHFVWYFGDGNISTQSNPVHTYNNPGSYYVTLIAHNECGNDTTSETIHISEPPNMINEYSSLAKIYPNPTHDILCIDSKDIIEFRIINVFGTTIFTSSEKNLFRILPHCLSLSQLHPAPYIIEIRTTNKTEKILFIKL